LGKSKKYDGYKAYQYLEAGFDYREYKLCKEINRVPSYVVPLSRNEEDRFEEIVDKNILISVHDHPTLFPEDMSQVIDLMHSGRQFLAYEALSLSRLDCVFDNMMNGSAYITSYMGWKWTDIIHDLGIRLSDLHHQKMVTHCQRVEDIKRAHDNGQVSLVFCLESSTPIENELDRIDILYGLGIRSMGICYSESNLLGAGMGETDKTGGLTDFGYDAIRRMNKLGMLIDVGHTNDRTALQTIEASTAPIYNSHSGPAAIAQGHTTGDEILHTLAEKDGLIGVGGAGKGLRTQKHPVGNIESYMECVEYCIDLMGIDHVGCGPDTLFGDHQDFYKYWDMHKLGHYSGPNMKQSNSTSTKVEDPGYVKGLENVTEFVNIPRWMIKHGYSDDEITKIIGLNALRLLEKAWR